MCPCAKLIEPVSAEGAHAVGEEGAKPNADEGADGGGAADGRASGFDGFAVLWGEVVLEVGLGEVGEVLLVLGRLAEGRQTVVEDHFG